MRFLAHHNPFSRGRWLMLSSLLDDEKGRRWLAGLENPTRTRHSFRIYTIPGDLTSDWIKLNGQHEVGTERFILDHLEPRTTLLDIGANIGYFSLLAAAVRGARVVAFEPQREVAELLRRSAAHNQVSGLVQVEELALSDAPATMRMTDCPRNTGHSQLVGADAEGAQPYPVSVVAFDDWEKDNSLGRVSVCKIDTEGSELRVLAGMERLLDRDGPAIVLEVIEEFLTEFGASGKSILELLGRRGYRDVSNRYTSLGDRNRYFVREPGATAG
jgi:FkbM family methyltransferase